MPLIAAGVISGIGALTKGAQGLSQISNANKLAANNKRPQYNIEDEYYNNQNLAETMAMGGLPQSSMNYYNSEAQRGLSSAENAAIELGGGLNSIAGLYNNYQQGVAGIAAKDAQLKTDNIRYLIDRNKDLAGQKTQQWVLNKYEPFKDTARAAAQEKSAGIQNITGALSDAAGVATGIATGSMNAGLTKQAPSPTIQPETRNLTPIQAAPVQDIGTASQYAAPQPLAPTSVQPLQPSYQNYSPAYPQMPDLTANDIYSLFYK